MSKLSERLRTRVREDDCFEAADRLDALEASHRELVLICEDFVRKVESGEARSKRTYVMMVNALANAKRLEEA